MAVKMTKEYREAIVNDYSNNKATLAELQTLYGFSTATISRMLAEEGIISLSNYKTKEEDRICKLLRAKGITTAVQLNEVLSDFKKT